MLLNYPINCSYWKGNLPRQGWLYLSVTHLCFYSYLLGKETRIILRWTDVTGLEKINSFLFPDSIEVSTRQAEVNYPSIKYYLGIWNYPKCMCITNWPFFLLVSLFHVPTQVGDFRSNDTTGKLGHETVRQQYR
jgi:hypothetical protein